MCTWSPVTAASSADMPTGQPNAFVTLFLAAEQVRLYVADPTVLDQLITTAAEARDLLVASRAGQDRLPIASVAG